MQVLRSFRSLPRFQRSILVALLILSLTSFGFLLVSFREASAVMTRPNAGFADASGGQGAPSRAANGRPEGEQYFGQPRARLRPQTSFNESHGVVIEYRPNSIPQFSGPQNARQRAVRDAFQHAWAGYKRYAWGKDQLKPVSGGHQEWFGLGLTILDGMDTAVIMGLKEEYEEARAFVSQLDMGSKRKVNLFEVTIRCLAGLLSTFHLTGDALFKDKALDLGKRLLGAFKTPSGIPLSDVLLETGRASAPQWTSDSSLSEVTTIQLEFRDLSRVTGQPVFENTAFEVSKRIHTKGCNGRSGLCPIYVNPKTGQFRTTTITLGARGDSFYEYLLKQYLQTGKTIDWLKSDYVQAMDGVDKRLWATSIPNGLGFVGELLQNDKLSPKMDHLLCFLSGTLALGVHSAVLSDDPARAGRHTHMSRALADTCVAMYNSTPTGLAPEIVYFNTVPGAREDMVIKPLDAHYLLRPETVESLFYLRRITGEARYADMGWQIFQAIEKYTKVPNGYTTLGSVKKLPPPKRDMMESYFLAETLKYLYLLFADDQETLLPLSQWVFNTEGHPLPIYQT